MAWPMPLGSVSPGGPVSALQLSVGWGRWRVHRPPASLRGPTIRTQGDPFHVATVTSLCKVGAENIRILYFWWLESQNQPRGLQSGVGGAGSVRRSPGGEPVSGLFSHKRACVPSLLHLQSPDPAFSSLTSKPSCVSVVRMPGGYRGPARLMQDTPAILRSFTVIGRVPFAVSVHAFTGLGSG